MPKYLIECKITSKSALNKLKVRDGAAKLGLLQGLVAGGNCYGLYQAPSEKTLRAHASRGGIPVSRVSRVTSIIDPTKLSIIDPTK